jgi:hypothetical protein
LRRNNIAVSEMAEVEFDAWLKTPFERTSSIVIAGLA